MKKVSNINIEETIKFQLFWKSDVFEFFSLRHHFQHSKIYKKPSPIQNIIFYCKLV